MEKRRPEDLLGPLLYIPEGLQVSKVLNVCSGQEHAVDLEKRVYIGRHARAPNKCKKQTWRTETICGICRDVAILDLSALNCITKSSRVTASIAHVTAGCELVPFREDGT